MSYTHSWRRPQTVGVEKYRKIRKDFEKILPRFDCKLVDGMDKDTEFEILTNLICFKHDEDSEFSGGTFYFPRKIIRFIGSVRTDWSCKADNKDYNLVVQSVLLILKKHLGKRLTVTTEGRHHNWADCFTVCSDVLGYGAEYGIDNNGTLFKIDEDIPYYAPEREEKVKKIVAQMEDFVNTSNLDSRCQEFCQEMMRYHPGLKQNFTQLCLIWINELSKLDHDDPRMDVAVQVSKEICSKFKSFEGKLPYDFAFPKF